MSTVNIKNRSNETKAGANSFPAMNISSNHFQLLADAAPSQCQVDPSTVVTVTSDVTLGHGRRRASGETHSSEIAVAHAASCYSIGKAQRSLVSTHSRYEEMTA